MESLYAVILNWNLAQATIDCARSLLADGFHAPQILVVDNGSSDGSPAQIEAALGSSVRLIRSEINLGFAGGCNLGIGAALADGAAWVLLLNNDTMAQPGLLNELVLATTVHPEIRVWGPLILYYDRPDAIWALGDLSIGGTLLTRHVARNRTIPPDLPFRVEVDYLTGCALAVHADVFRAIGLLDSSYFMYAEDADFCLRARRAGFRLACWTPARILHKVSQSTGMESPRARFWRTGYQARFYRRSARGAHLSLLFAASTLRAALMSARDALAGRRALAAAGVRGWREGWFAAVDTPLGDVPQPAPTRNLEPTQIRQVAPWNE